jgi:hypothetical protein
MAFPLVAALLNAAHDRWEKGVRAESDHGDDQFSAVPACDTALTHHQTLSA